MITFKCPIVNYIKFLVNFQEKRIVPVAVRIIIGNKCLTQCYTDLYASYMWV